MEAVDNLGGTCLIVTTATRSRCWSRTASARTAHTTNPVPLVVTNATFGLRAGGELKDLMPTALDLLGIEQPSAMTGLEPGGGSLSEAILPRPCLSSSQIWGFCGRLNAATTVRL